MKKLKLFLLTIVAVAGVCGFSSCKDDDDKGGASSIVGTWKWQDADGSYDAYTFNADGSYVNVWFETDKGPNAVPQTDRGTYTYDGKVLNMNSKTYGWSDTCNATISGNRLIFDYGDGDTETYVRQ